MTAARLVREVEGLLGDPGRLAAMAEAAAARVGRRDAADAVAELVEQCARG